ncbi:major royal jelly protein-domain-containing protein [Neurospora tetraspora]|uniref:Major royal jelly protein-domain-containing protein n=1 Tax=Neurospora tetraspora TaxID=94610 RepID=A0AAE0J203_9PEZI|nr:major royal jelly protein-domain-containing protein [Neurospora tetraspora]
MARLTALTFLILQTLAVNADVYDNNPYNFTFPADPGVSGPPLEVIHAYFGQWPTGIAVSSTGRLFSNFPGGLDPTNVNNGTPGIFTVGELVSPSTEKAYPSVEMNTPPCPGGAVNLTDPQNPVGCGSADHLIAVQSVVIDPLDRLWILDTGRPLYTFPNGSVILLRSSYGGPKLIGVDLSTDKIFQTILFPPEVALPGGTYLNDVRFDLRPNVTSSGAGMAYITDSSLNGQNGIIVVDLGTGDSWRRLQRQPSVLPEEKFVPFVWGQPIYSAPDPGHAPTGNLTTTSPPGYISFGSDGIAISADGETLFYGAVAGRNLYSVPTALLRQRDDAVESELVKAVVNHGQTGNSDGMETDSNGVIYKGNNEANSLVAFDPATGTTQTVVRDPRIGWVDTLSVADDPKEEGRGFVYFTSNQLHLSGAMWSPGEEGDRRKRPFGLFRVPLLENGTKISAPEGAR